MKMVNIIICIFIFIFSISLSAQENTVIDAVKKKYSGKLSLDLTFDVNIFWKVREKYEKKNGMLLMVPGDKFRCKIGSTEWVSNGHIYWQYNEKTSQVIVKNLLDIDLSMHPSQMIQRYLSYPFKVESSDEKQAVFIWTASEDNQDRSYKKITLTIDKKKNILKELVTVNRDGNESTYIFKKVKIGSEIPLEVFSFKIPKGVDVLDTRD